MGQEPCGDVEGNEQMPKENQEASFQKAWQKNVRVMSWIITSDDPVIWINLRMYETTKEMCNCLKSM